MLFAGRAPDVADHLLGRRLGPSGTSPGDQGGGFLAHLHSLAVTMSQKSSASQPASDVSWAPTPDKPQHQGCEALGRIGRVVHPRRSMQPMAAMPASVIGALLGVALVQ